MRQDGRAGNGGNATAAWRAPSDGFVDGQDAVGATQQEQASRAASAIYKAMKGGVRGFGTKEKEIFEALANKTPEQIAQIRDVYRDHFNRDLDEDLGSELSGTHAARANRLLAADATGADLVVLEDALPQDRALPGGTEASAIIDLLSTRTPQQVASLKAAWEQKHGSLEEALNEKLDGADKVLAGAILGGDRNLTQAASLRRALDAGDDKGVLATLERNGDPAGMSQAFQRTFGVSVTDALNSQFKGERRDRLLALSRGDRPLADAARLRGSLRDGETAVAEIRGTLENRTPPEREAILSAYRRQYGSTFVGDADKLGGERAQMARTLAETSSVSVAQVLHQALDGVGTDESAIMSALTGRTRPELEAIRSEYQNRYGEDLEQRLKKELSGRSEFDVVQLLKGPPATAEEAVQRMEETHSFERGGWRNAVSTVVMDGVNDEGERLDSAVERAKAFYEAGKRDGTLDAGELQRLRELVEFSTDDAALYHASKESTAGAAATAAALAISGAATLATGGLAAPAAASATAAAAGTATAATAATATAAAAGTATAATAATAAAAGTATAATAATATAAAAGTAAAAAAATSASTGMTIAATVAAGAVAGGVARPGIHAAVIGKGYEADDALKDAAIGAVQGGSAAGGSVVGDRLGRVAMAGAPEGVRATVAGRAVSAAAKAGIVGSTSTAAARATDEATWEHGLNAGLKSVAAGFAEGGARAIAVPGGEFFTRSGADAGAGAGSSDEVPAAPAPTPPSDEK